MADYHRYKWEDIERGVLKLVQDILKSDFQPDAIIGISKGGVIIASLISDMLGIPTDLMQLSHWNFSRVKNNVIIKYRPSIDVRNLRVLLIDDVSDTGLTLNEAREELMKVGAREVKTAVLDYKVLSSKYVPDYYAYKWITWVYIIYPWENFETFKSIGINEAKIVFADYELVKMQELMRT
ncbi:MAG: phosphoribosyltransferase [Vulcanisaeta sp.]|jgi:hypoxanthine phosphoribosyltransferase|uniref:phosphoribosyltransferase n=1 Tax=Vulcanisaeta TaxID=164450 RepID=UPI00064F9F01|nr:phosphoribosyltransferase [Vulcanisaeta moutnovskia]